MVNATVDNSPVSISLNEAESTTVPSGEVWRVTISLGIDDGGSTYNDEYLAKVEINGTPAISHQTVGGSTYGGGATSSIETVLTGGDSISCEIVTDEANSAGCHIGGFVVN